MDAIPWYNNPEEVEKSDIFIEDNYDEQLLKELDFEEGDKGE